MSFRYIGSKARLVDVLENYIPQHKQGDGRFVDAFCGMGHVALCAQKKGWPIWVNDQMNYATMISFSRLIEHNSVKFDNIGGYTRAIEILNSIPGEKGFIWREYSPASEEFIGFERRYFSEENALKIDGILKKIKEWKENKIINSEEEKVLRANLMEATNVVSNIAGTYGCFLSKWSSASQKKLLMKTGIFSAYKTEVFSTTQKVNNLEVNENDLVYLDPPYSKRQYASYYHILETIALGDEPQVEGVSGLRPWKDKSSEFCYKRKALDAMEQLIINMNAKNILISYSNDGHIQLDEFENRLMKHGTVELIELNSINRYKSNNLGNIKNKEVKEYLIRFERK